MAKLIKFSPRYGSAVYLDVSTLKQADIQALVGLIAVMPIVKSYDWSGDDNLFYAGFPEIRIIVREDIHPDEATVEAAIKAKREAEKAAMEAKAKETAEA